LFLAVAVVAIIIIIVVITVVIIMIVDVVIVIVIVDGCIFRWPRKLKLQAVRRNKWMDMMELELERCRGNKKQVKVRSSYAHNIGHFLIF